MILHICTDAHAVILAGLPNNGTVECYIQAFLTNAFPLATIFWTTTIAYMVFCIIYKSRKIDVNSKEILLVTFALPVVLTLLPLSTETYGSPENEGGLHALIGIFVWTYTYRTDSLFTIFYPR